MFDWLVGFIERWAPLVPSPVRDLVHWVAHAVTGVVYSVFGLVGLAWRKVFGAAHWLELAAAGFAHQVWRHLEHIVVYWIPHILRLIRGWVDYILRLIAKDVIWLIGRVLFYYRVLRTALDVAVRWIVHSLIDPLRAYANTIWHHLILWGYYAFYYVTHPDKLAAVLIRAMVKAAMDAFWDIARPVGDFAVRLILANVRRLVLLAETIISAVL